MRTSPGMSTPACACRLGRAPRDVYAGLVKAVCKGIRHALSIFAATGLTLAAPSARGEDAPAPTSGPTPETPPASATPAPATEALERAPPPDRPSIQYGVAFTVEGVADAGPICSNPNSPCILGSGGGIAIRVGFRPTEDLYVGGAYEFSKQDPAKLYRLAILQQVRGEVRHYFRTGRSITPYAVAGAGLGGYGNEWNVDTWGPTATVGVGLEVELSGGTTLLGVALVYRPLYLHSFVDSAMLAHPSGISHFVGLELALEAREAL